MDKGCMFSYNQCLWRLHKLRPTSMKTIPSALKVIEEGEKWMKAMSLHGPSFSLSRVCSVGFGSDTVHINS